MPLLNLKKESTLLDNGPVSSSVLHTQNTYEVYRPPTLITNVYTCCVLTIPFVTFLVVDVGRMMCGDYSKWLPTWLISQH